jgi:hypothetical protein
MVRKIPTKRGSWPKNPTTPAWMAREARRRRMAELKKAGVWSGLRTAAIPRQRGIQIWPSPIWEV